MVICFVLFVLLLQRLKSWLHDVATCLVSKKFKSIVDNGKRMCSVLVILELLMKIDGNLEPKEQIERNVGDHYYLFSMLYLISEQEDRRDLNTFLSFIPNKNKEHVVELLVKYIKLVLHRCSLENNEWLCMVPLIHILKNRIEPFDEITPATLKWRDPDIDLNSVKLSTMKYVFKNFLLYYKTTA